MDDMRWKQRFENFEKAYTHFKTVYLDAGALSDLEKTGSIKRFEFTFELAWKTMKDYLDHQGTPPKERTARPTIKEAFAAGIIEDGKTWIAMLETRNALVHTYDEKMFREEFDTIQKHYGAALEQFYQYMKHQAENA